MQRTRNKTYTRIVLVAILPVIGLVGSVHQSCLPVEGGLNANEQRPGNQDGGVDLGPSSDVPGYNFGSIAVDRLGRYFLSSVDGSLVYGDLLNGGTTVVPSIDEPERVAFANGSSIFYVTSRAQERLVAYDAQGRRILWDVYARSEGDRPWVDVTDDDSWIVLTYGRKIDVLRAEDGMLLRTVYFDDPIVDVDVLGMRVYRSPMLAEEPGAETHDSDDGLGDAIAPRIIVTLDHGWLGLEDDEVPNIPRTEVHRVDIGTGETHVIEVPNCSSEMVIEPTGRWGFLAPTFCRDPEERSCDPVSVIDLASGRFIRNLPGFGPVAMSPKGTTAIAFMDRDNLDESLFDDPSQIPTSGSRFRIMVIDTRELTFRSYEIGDALPRYALTPDGTVLLVDVDWVWGSESLRVLDLRTGELVEVAGDPIQMDEFVLTGDSSWSYILDDADSTPFHLDYSLYELNIDEALLTNMDLDFEASSLNITPDDAHLLLKDLHEGSIYQYSLEERDVVREFTAFHDPEG